MIVISNLNDDFNKGMVKAVTINSNSSASMAASSSSGLSGSALVNKEQGSGVHAPAKSVNSDTVEVKQPST